MQELGLTGLLGEHNMALRALAPVPDKPYLECLAALPRPGHQLSARPGSTVLGRRASKGVKRRPKKQ